MFNQPQSYHSVSPKCNIGQSEDLPVFLKMIGIAELIGFEKHFKALSYKIHDGGILTKINENCR